MDPLAEDFVPKVHPLERAVEPDDPLELIAAPVQGDPQVMLQCMIEEFAWMGCDAEQLLALFHNPNYPVLQQLREHLGDDVVRSRIAELLGQTGTLRFTEQIAEDPEADDDDDSELIQLNIRCADQGPF